MPYWWSRHVVQTPQFNKNNGVLTNYGTRASCKLVSSFHVSSFLEIQEFYGKDKNSSKEYHPHQEHWSDNWEKAVTESKLLFQIILHSIHSFRAHHCNFCCHVTELSCDECINRPGQRAEPIVPYPPPRYLLQRQQGKKKKETLI